MGGKFTKRSRSDEACQVNISSAQAKGSDPASSLKQSVSNSADISYGMKPRRTPSGKILPASEKMRGRRARQVDVPPARKSSHRVVNVAKSAACQRDEFSARARSSDAIANVSKKSVSKNTDISSGMISHRLTASGKIITLPIKMQRTRGAYPGDISSAQARSSDQAFVLEPSVSRSADIFSGMISPRHTPSGKTASEYMRSRIRSGMTSGMISTGHTTGPPHDWKGYPPMRRKSSFNMRSMSEMTESSPESAEGKGKSLRYTTGIAGNKRAFNRPPLSDLLKRCEILDSVYHSDPTAVEMLATLVTEGKLTNGLCLAIWPSYIACTIESLLHQHQDMNVLLVNWSCEHLSFERNHRLLQISLGSEHILRHIPEGKPGYHIKIFLDDDGTQLTEDDHESIFRSIVTPVAEEFKPDMVFFLLDVLLPWSHWMCVGRLTGMLMKLADGKVIVCKAFNPPDITEVLLHTLLFDNNDTLLGPYHPTAEGSKIIEETVKKYGEHWKCLREVYSPARVTEDKYYALRKTEEEVATTSKTVRNFSTILQAIIGDEKLDSEVVASTSEKAQGSDNQTTLDENRQEKLELSQEETRQTSNSANTSDVDSESSSSSSEIEVNLQSTDLSEPDEEDENCDIFTDESTNSKHIALTSSSLTNPDVGSSNLGKEFHVSAGSESLKGPRAHCSVDRQMSDLYSLEEVVVTDDDGAGERSQDQTNMSLPSTSLGRIAVKLEDLRLSSTVSIESEADGEDCKISPDLPCSSRHTAQTLYRLTDPSVELGGLGEECSHFLAQDIGIEGGNIELHSHEIHFPENAVDETIHTKFSISLETDLDLPSNLVPISHVLHCSPGKKIFNKHVTVKMPVWLKLASIAQPVNIHVYSCHEGRPWEREGTVALGTAEAISFHCLHFCRKVIVVDTDDIMNGEFSIDYFLCMKKTGNFLSCHCVSTALMVDTLEKRMEKCGYRTLHPAISRITVTVGTEIPVSLVSQQPQLYKVHPENGFNFTISDEFRRKNLYKSFPFKLTFVEDIVPKMFSLMYNVGDEAFPIDEEIQMPSSGQDSMHKHSEGIKNGSQTSVKVDVHVGDKVGEINANAIATRNGVVTQDQSNCRNVASSN